MRELQHQFIALHFALCRLTMWLEACAINALPECTSDTYSSQTAQSRVLRKPPPTASPPTTCTHKTGRDETLEHIIMQSSWRDAFAVVGILAVDDDVVVVVGAARMSCCVVSALHCASLTLYVIVFVSGLRSIRVPTHMPTPTPSRHHWSGVCAGRGVNARFVIPSTFARKQPNEK